MNPVQVWLENIIAMKRSISLYFGTEPSDLDGTELCNYMGWSWAMDEKNNFYWGINEDAVNAMIKEGSANKVTRFIEADDYFMIFIQDCNDDFPFPAIFESDKRINI